MIKAYHLVPGITNYSSIPHWLLEFFLLHIFSYISHMMRKKISTVKFFSACMKDNKYLGSYNMHNELKRGKKSQFQMCVWMVA